MINIFELYIWGILTLILMRLNEKPIYDHLQDLKFKYNQFMGIEEDINQYEIISED